MDFPLSLNEKQLVIEFNKRSTWKPKFVLIKKTPTGLVVLRSVMVRKVALYYSNADERVKYRKIYRDPHGATN